MNKFIVAITDVKLLLLLVLCSLDTTTGLKCYRCVYEELDGEMVGDGTASCMDIENLNEDDLVECSKVEVKSSSALENNSESLGLPNFEQRSNRDRVWGCYTFRVSGEVAGVHGRYVGVVRTCLGNEYDDVGQNNCQEKTMKSWREGNDGEMSKVITEIWSPQSDESLVNANYCREDKCNNRQAVKCATGTAAFPSLLSITLVVGFAVFNQY